MDTEESFNFVNKSSRRNNMPAVFKSTNFGSHAAKNLIKIRTGIPKTRNSSYGQVDFLKRGDGLKAHAVNIINNHSKL